MQLLARLLTYQAQSADCVAHFRPIKAVNRNSLAYLQATIFRRDLAF